MDRTRDLFPGHRMKSLTVVCPGPEEGGINSIDLFENLTWDGLMTRPVYGDSRSNRLDQNSSTCWGKSTALPFRSPWLNSADGVVPGCPLITFEL